MCYLWGDLGVIPSESCFNIHGLITSHYTKSGGYYPVGGASEFALSMIPIVERAGGKVLVRANVEQGGNSIEKIGLNFGLNFGMRFPTPRKSSKIGSLDMSQNQYGISSPFSSQNSS